VLVLIRFRNRFSAMSERNVTAVSKRKVSGQKPSETAEALRKGFSEAVKVAVKDHRAAGRSVHEAAAKPSRPR
jgi:hypothetical protein